MSRIATRIVRLGVAGSVAALMAMPAISATRPDQPVQAWPAMAGVDTATLLEQAQDLPTSDMAVGDQPYCAADAEIQQTLRHDFNETPVPGDGHAATELWASDQMGTWTLVAPRRDDTSCIIASGIGYDQARDVDVYYQTAGLR
ncbi:MULTISPECIES: hypothetical protein [Paracoccus]|uniref:Uncharacterized protein n=1 Tax=Paracoccus aerius TaxID=1915382 RepID=A0ABS1S0Y4_9RHOB|nr:MULTISPECIES: hypothetical protein [Paracoccus]MBL3671995.1 hypothetical protein [Paracoccus aerius]QIR83740.1 hypothetical protein FIU66_00120 [Paracoccus sp. AK26]GHG13434.1 hypothetical protein GCM10017322_06800 [Paracoccus aerius]